MSVLKELHSLKGDKAKTFRFIKENKKSLIDEKKRMPKNNISIKVDESMIITPEFEDIASLGLNDEEVFIVGNSVGFFDGHEDVSLKGSWTKTAQERGNRIPIVKDHRYLIDNIFAKNIETLIVDLPIRALGYDQDGVTEVIGFKIKPYTEIDLQKYKDNSINQHSMGLRYIKLVLAINDPEFEDEFKEWTKYIDQVINKEAVEENGYFWGIQEQKAIEVSSVVLASNPFTPAYTNKSLIGEPLKNTPKTKEPIKSSNFFKTLIHS